MPPAQPPLLPPYGHLDQRAVQCVAEVSRYYDVPELLLHAILQKENGRVGTMSKNKNGSFDLGLAQINTTWLPLFARYGISGKAIRDDTCTNIYVEGWVLRYNANLLAGDWFKATAAYNVGVNAGAAARDRIGYRYAADVVSRWWALHRYVVAQLPPPGPIVSKPTPSATAASTPDTDAGDF